jgi:hypothetical protein
MKTVIAIALMMCFSTYSSAQTAPEIDPKINLRLENLEKFGNQHRVGNGILLAGVGIVGISTIVNNQNRDNLSSTNSLKVKEAEKNIKTANTLMLVGSIISGVGVVINMNSFKHLRVN